MRRALCGTREGARIWLNLDFCGFICALMAWGLVAYAQYVVTADIIMPWLGTSVHGLFHMILFNAIAAMCYISHFKCMTTDPGSVSHNAAPLNDASGGDLEAPGANTALIGSDGRRVHRWCSRCDAFKPPRAHHCSVCKRCIVKMDHHCPWMNSCIAIGNQKFFIQFITYTFVLCTYALLLVVSRFFTCFRSGGEEGDLGGCLSLDSGLLIVFLIVESFLFGSFTLCMALDQWQVVTSGQTQIDRLKARAAAINQNATQTNTQDMHTDTHPADMHTNTDTHTHTEERESGGVSERAPMSTVISPPAPMNNTVAASGESHAAFGEVSEVFGGPKRCRLDWFLPTDPVFPPDVKDDILGYRIAPREREPQQEVELQTTRASAVSSMSSSKAQSKTGGFRERKSVNPVLELERMPSSAV